MSGGRLKAGCLLVLMFVLGAVSGMAWETHQMNQKGLHQLYVNKRVHWMTHQLHLTPIQEEALRQIIEDAHDRVMQVRRSISGDLADIHEESLDNFRDFLTPEQREKFETLHAQSHHGQHLREEREKDIHLVPSESNEGSVVSEG
jgi:Spy/CpxP family protein refolding chaperone